VCPLRARAGAALISTPDILFADADFFVVNKPAGLSTHGAFEGDLALHEWIALHWGEATHVCSRLDKGTSGVLPLARTASAAAAAQAVHESETACKFYVFLSHRDTGGPSEWTVDTPIEGLAARTTFRRLGACGDAYLYEARIARGRTHQVRRHAAAEGIAVLGDVEHGGAPGPRLYLHCARVDWPGQASPWQAPLPASFTHPLRGTGFPEALDRRLCLPASISTAWRALHRGELRGLDAAIDVYGDHLCAWLYGPDPERRLPGLTEELASRLHLRGGVVKLPRRNPHANKLVVDQTTFGEPPPAAFEVSEHGLRYGVTLTERQHTGLFLDQRDNRRLAWQVARGARVANLFAFTCSFTVAALAGGAEVVFSVDASRKILDLGSKNLDINGLSVSGRGKFVAEDVRAWLARQGRKVAREGDAARFGLVVCDPPTFSSTRKDRFSVESAWDELALGVASVLAPGGVALFSTNHRAGTRDVYRRALERRFGQVERRSDSVDFPRDNNGIEHLKAFVCRAPS